MSVLVILLFDQLPFGSQIICIQEHWNRFRLRRGKGLVYSVSPRFTWSLCLVQWGFVLFSPLLTPILRRINPLMLAPHDLPYASQATLGVASEVGLEHSTARLQLTSSNKCLVQLGFILP